MEQRESLVHDLEKSLEGRDPSEPFGTLRVYSQRPELRPSHEILQNVPLAIGASLRSDIGPVRAAAIAIADQGHSWIAITPIAGDTDTYGTHPNPTHPKTNLLRHHEAGLCRNREQMSQMLEGDRNCFLERDITVGQAQKLCNFLKSVERLGPDSWDLKEHPCTTFAAAGLFVTTGERIKGQVHGIPCPAALAKSIEQDNIHQEIINSPNR